MSMSWEESFGLHLGEQTARRASLLQPLHPEIVQQLGPGLIPDCTLEKIVTTLISEFIAL
jgi:hypothetical protein